MTTVGDIMTKSVTTLTPSQDLTHADAIMSKGRLRHLPVVVEGKVVGLITHRDLLRAQIETLARVMAMKKVEGTRLVSLPASERMIKTVLTVSATMPASEAARVMLEGKIGCLPVVDEDEQLVGIVTESDFLKWTLDAT